MRRGSIVLLAFLSTALLAQKPTDFAREQAREDGTATMEELIARAKDEKKPLVVFFRSPACARCREFEEVTVIHPTIQRRLPSVVFGTLPGEEAGVALFDRSGALRARWPIVPDAMNFGMILDAAIAVAPQFERAAQLEESGSPFEAQLAIADALIRLGRISGARTALRSALAAGPGATQQKATVAMAILDANDGNARQALENLERVAANPATPEIAKDARAAIEAIHGTTAGTPRAQESAAIRILPLSRQVVSGKQLVRTHVSSVAVARVAFSLDGRERQRVVRPPFSTSLDFGAVPERHVIGVVAFDRGGREVGRDERVVNEAGETFWLRLAEPRGPFAEGAVRVSLNVRAPSAHRLRRVVLSWNDATRAVLTNAPWTTTVRIAGGQAGVLRAVAELDDGRTTEDAVLLNAGGAAEQVSVQLVELPVTIVTPTGAVPEITPDRITVREGKKTRRVESIATAAETPLTVGLLIDVSDSMQKSLPDVQEAAIRFLQTILGERDRAFVITFDSRARLVQPATSDVDLLRRQIMAFHPDGLTALHDAMVLGLLQFEGIKGRRAMIVFSDGLDRTSTYSAADVSELARRVNVPIHAFAASTDATADDLKHVARATGGTAHTLTSLAELPDVFARIEAALRAQLLVFVRTDPATRENDWRSVQVELAGEDLEVHAPAGYYASW